MKNFQKQTDIKNITDLYQGYLIQFINEYDFTQPYVRLEGNSTISMDISDFQDLEWRSDILIDNDFNLLVPTYYKGELNGDDELEPEYYPEELIDFKTIVFPQILEWMREDEHPAYIEYFNIIK